MVLENTLSTEQKVLIVMPDHLGEITSLLEDNKPCSASEVLDNSRYHLYLQLNAGHEGDLERKIEHFHAQRTKPENLDLRIVHECNGVVDLLTDGCRKALASSSFSHVLFMDDKEHDPAHIPALLAAADRSIVAVGDLDYSQKDLGEHDQALERIFAKQLLLTNANFQVSAVHGLNAWSLRDHELFQHIVEQRNVILRETNNRQKTYGMPNVQWGGHLAMLFAADDVGCTPEVLKFDAMTDRCRERQKTIDQLSAFFKIFTTVRQMRASFLKISGEDI